ncbi:MAG: C4-type zinc ribbon domain-containing protein [Thermoanaerobaculia bacterium]|nr:C4-type zinc ribbon domain-containing protein [Thermoanaerobaculia bacterium]
MSDLDSIVELNKTLQELAAARQRLDGIPDWMEELHEEHSGRLAEIEGEEARRAEAEKVRREAEAAVSDAQEKLQRYQLQISQVTTQREYGALLKEIDGVKTEIKENEEAAVAAMEASEEAEQQVETMRSDFQELDQRYQDELAKWEEEKPGVEETAAHLKQRAEELKKEVPRGLLSLFQRLYERTNGNAVAEVVRLPMVKGNPMYHCTACNYNVRPQTLVELSRGQIHHCDSCKRILYYKPDAGEA